MTRIQVCQWIGDDDCCRQSTLFGKSYCEIHYQRAYLIVPTEMAEYIIDKELQSDIDFLKSDKGDKDP